MLDGTWERERATGVPTADWHQRWASPVVIAVRRSSPCPRSCILLATMHLRTDGRRRRRGRRHTADERRYRPAAVLTRSLRSCSRVRTSSHVKGSSAPETGAVVHVDLEAGRFLKFFLNALNQLDEAAPVISQSRMSVKIWRHAGTASKAVAARAPLAHGRQDENLRGVSGRRSGVHRSRRAGVLCACPHSGCKRASPVKEVFAEGSAWHSKRLNRGDQLQGSRHEVAWVPSEARVPPPLLQRSQR